MSHFVIFIIGFLCGAYCFYREADKVKDIKEDIEKGMK